MKASELRDKSVDELNQQLLKLREEQFKLRMANATGQLGQSHLLKQRTSSGWAVTSSRMMSLRVIRSSAQ